MEGIGESAGSVEKGLEKAVVGAERVWTVSWMRERGWRARRMIGERRDRRKVSCDFDAGPGGDVLL